MPTMPGNLKARPLPCTYVIQKEGATAEQTYNTLMDFIAAGFLAADGGFCRGKEQFVITKGVSVKFKPNVYTRARDGAIRYKLKFQCRDGRLKMEMTNFTHTPHGTSKASGDLCAFGLIKNEFEDLHNMTPKSRNEKIWNQIMEICKAEAETMKAKIESLEMGSTAQDQEDW